MQWCRACRIYIVINFSLLGSCLVKQQHVYLTSLSIYIIKIPIRLSMRHANLKKYIYP